jgi:glycosyltransferase involved in cell wall biosynthesis
MKISVVIPAYNEESFLPRLLTSLRQQTFSLPYEVIVVDNNSTDKTAQIAKKFGAKVIHEKKRGYAYACKAGFEAAKGDIIARADADYVQPKDWLEKIYTAFKKDPKLIALGGPTFPLESHWWENLVYYPTIVFWMEFLKLLGRGFLFPNMAVRRQAYKKSGGFNTTITFGEDVDICLRLKKVGKIKLILSIYNYSSIRRLSALGLYDYVVKYTCGNQLAVWLGLEVSVGLDPVRYVPPTKPKQYNPWIFLYGTPALLSILLLLLSTFFIPVETTTKMVQTTEKVAQLSNKALQKKIKVIKSYTLNSFMFIQPLKEI